MTLEEIYDAHGDALYRYLTLKLGSAQDAEDVLQEVFVRLARYADRRRFLRDPKAFAFRCAHNEANRFWKRKLVRRDREAAFRPELASASSGARMKLLRPIWAKPWPACLPNNGRRSS